MLSLSEYISNCMFESMQELELVKQKFSKDEIFNRVVLTYPVEIIHVLQYWNSTKHVVGNYSDIDFFKKDNNKTTNDFLNDFVNLLENNDNLNIGKDQLKFYKETKDLLHLLMSIDIYLRYDNNQNILYTYTYDTMSKLVVNLINEYKSKMNLCNDWFLQYYNILAYYTDICGYYKGFVPLYNVDFGLEFKDISYNDWVISFCYKNVFKKILQQGFIKGSNIKNMCISQNAKKIKNGYNFGYKLKNINSIINENFISYLDSRSSIEYICLNGMYGHYGFVFITDSLDMYHHIDKAEQNVFYGSDVKNFIPFRINTNGQVEILQYDDNKISTIKTFGKKIYPTETFYYTGESKNSCQGLWSEELKTEYHNIKDTFINNIKEFQQFILNTDIDDLKQYFIAI